MATEAQLIGALRQADAAGDRAGAARIAAMIQAARGSARAPANAPAAPAGGYRGDLASRTDANINALKRTIGDVAAHPDWTSAPKILGAVGNYAVNAMGIPLAAGVDQVTGPVVRGVNNALGTTFDPHYATDQLLNAGGILAGGAPEALAAMKESGAMRGAQAASEAAPRPPPTVAHAQAAPVAPAAVSPAGVPAPPAASVTSLTPVESSALTKFTRVAKPDVNAMSGKAAAYGEAGIAPTLVDTTGRRGQGIVRALATRATPAQDNVEQFAEQRRVGLASRMSDQAKKIISTDPRTPEEIAQSVIDARNAQAEKDFGPVRGQMVSVTPDMEDALTSPFGIRAIRTAWQRAVDPQAREALRLLYDHVNPGTSGQAAGSLKGAQISVGQAQDISKALFDDAASAKDPGDSGPMKYFGQVIRQGASMQSPEYEVALGRFANASGLAEAPEIGRRALNGATDTFITDLDRLKAIPSEPAADGTANAPIGVELAKPGFRRAIETASGGGRPGTAMGVAQTLADAPEQQVKNAALLGDDDAGRLQNAMRLERQAVINASNASPGAGSNTFLNQLAGGAVNGEVSPGEIAQTTASGLSLAHGNPVPAAMQAITVYLKNTRAFSDAEAEALANLAIDPSKHADALGFIAGRAGPQAAEDLAPVMQQAAGIPQPTGPAAVSAALAAGNAMNPQGGQQPPN